MKFLIVIISLFPTLFLYSQDIKHTGCGLGTKECLQLKKRLFANRKAISLAMLEQHERAATTTWLPITFYIVGDNTGYYYADTTLVQEAVCQLNQNFLDQNIQFYTKDRLYLNDSLLDYNPYDSLAQAHAATFKVPNTITIFVSRNQLYKDTYGADFSFYSLDHDFLVFDQQLLTAYNISTHEMGHFFSLLHTFLGWEYQTAADYANHIGNPAPDSFYLPDFGGGYIQVERVARTGATANCQTASDGFCDTPADYVNTAVNCTVSFDLRDPLNVPTNPDRGNLMSYYFCKNSFSPEQKAAMAADLISRGWNNLAPPNATLVDATGLQEVQPIDGQTISLNSNTVTLEWTPITGATQYELVLSRKHPIWPLSFVVLDTSFVTSTNSIAIDNAYLNLGDTYTWKVRGTNPYDKCSPFSSLFTFQVATLSSHQQIAALADWSIKAMVQNDAIDCIVDAPEITEGTVALYNVLGNQLLSTTVGFEKGQQVIHLPSCSYSKGVYLLVIQLKEGQSITQKIILGD